MIKKLSIFLLALICATGMARAENLNIAVSANLQFTFKDLKSVFETETGILIKGIVGSSGKLTSQIQNGAPFDVFLSADTEYPEILYVEGLTHNAPEIYAYGTLILWTFNAVDLSSGVNILSDSRIKKIATAAPLTAPYGRETINALKYYGLYEELKNKLVYGESVSQTNQFITSRAADIGFTAKSVVLAENTRGQGKWVEIKKEAYHPIAQAAVVLKFAEHNNLSAAGKFYKFLFSEKAHEIFKNHGYLLPEGKGMNPRASSGLSYP